MKYRLLNIFLLSSSLTAFPIFGAAEAMLKKEYATKGTLELFGGGAFSYQKSDYYQVDINLMAGANYFWFNNWYLGLGPGLNYTNNNSAGSTVSWIFSVSPSINLGLAAKITGAYFWFGEVGYGNYFSTSSGQNGFTFSSQNVSLRAGLKIDLGNGLFAVGPRMTQYFYTDPRFSNTFVLGVSFSYSVFF